MKTYNLLYTKIVEKAIYKLNNDTVPLLLELVIILGHLV